MRDRHVDEGEIHAWLDGALAPADAAAIETHVATCAECREAVAEARGLIAASSRILSALDAVPADVLPVSPRARRRSSFRLLAGWPIRAVAAAFVVAIGATVVLRREPRQASESDRASAGRFDSVRAAPATAAAQASSLSATPRRAVSAPTRSPALAAKIARATPQPKPAPPPPAPAPATEGDRRVRESLRDQTVNAIAVTGATAAPKLQKACDTLAHSRRADSLQALRILHGTTASLTASALGPAAMRTDSTHPHDSLARVPAKANRCP